MATRRWDWSIIPYLVPEVKAEVEMAGLRMQQARVDLFCCFLLRHATSTRLADLDWRSYTSGVRLKSRLTCKFLVGRLDGSTRVYSDVDLQDGNPTISAGFLVCRLACPTNASSFGPRQLGGGTCGSTAERRRRGNPSGNQSSRKTCGRHPV